MTLYVAYEEDDEYQLPVHIGDGNEMSSWLGVTLPTLYCSISRSSKGKQRVSGGYKVEAIKISKEYYLKD